MHTQTLPRTYLFVPASRPERFEKALDSGADKVIVDLEDAVAADAKDAAREGLVRWLASSTRSVMVRINSAGSQWHDADLEAIGHARNVEGMILPKVERPEVLQSVQQRCHPDMVLVPLIESVAGMERVESIACHPRVQRLMFGTIDFQVDLGTDLDDSQLNPFRLRMSMASRAAGIASPVDGVSTVLDDVEQLRADALQARRYGFGAKLCIHPRQLGPVISGFAPTDAERHWAERVVAAAAISGGEATSLDGAMIDLPVILKAQTILASLQ